MDEINNAAFTLAHMFLQGNDAGMDNVLAVISPRLRDAVLVQVVLQLGPEQQSKLACHFNTVALTVED